MKTLSPFFKEEQADILAVAMFPYCRILLPVCYNTEKQRLSGTLVSTSRMLLEGPLLYVAFSGFYITA
jgi:hypothetical protein